MGVEEEVIKFLKSDEMSKETEKVLRSYLDNQEAINYRLFGVSCETPIVTRVKEILDTSFCGIECIPAKDKNEFPDITIVIGGKKIALEIKSGCKSKDGSEIVNSNNDLGTIRSWSEKLSSFDQILYLYVIYSRKSKRVSSIESVIINEFYKFIGINRAGVLKYRKKDGNLRPANFSEFQNPVICTLKEFEELLELTNIYRSFDLVIEHLRISLDGLSNSKIEYSAEEYSCLEKCIKYTKSLKKLVSEYAKKRTKRI
ncbi:MAG TPA: hypothetical protein PK411_08750 [Mesotoga infera]|nr:hypothetical protein [Mesotoga infera]HRR44037.1 hypothetical protein [Mesotoga sp.]HRV01747.1 hypothetical protein [Mesotoga sp.]